MLFFNTQGWTSTLATLSGSITDSTGIAISDAHLVIQNGKIIQKCSSNSIGSYHFLNLNHREYNMKIRATGFRSKKISLFVHGHTIQNIQLVSKNQPVIQLIIRAKRVLLTNSSSSHRLITETQIQHLPEGTSASLSHLITSTTAGVIQGPFGQIFTRGNMANLQYDIDGIQLPDLPGGSFGQIFPTSDISSMTVLTGGLDAQYGTRLAGVVKIVTKSGQLVPNGQIGLNYGSYNQIEPFANYGGSNREGNFHYFFSTNSKYTERGLDTPEPSTPANPTEDLVGGSQSIHNQSYGSNQFLTLNWLMNNSNQWTLIGLSQNKFYQIPTYPSDFVASSPFFDGSTDSYGNGPFNYVPTNTNDTQSESNRFTEVSWEHLFNTRSFLKISPYWSQSNLIFTNDLSNDLAPITIASTLSADSFAMNQLVNNYGIQLHYTWHINSSNLFKAGLQTLWTQSGGPISVIYASRNAPGNAPTTLTSALNQTNNYYQEGIFMQDNITCLNWLFFNLGIRFDASQFLSPSANTSSGYVPAVDSTSSMVQPRIGISVLFTPLTKLHLFYGKLYMPPPPENLEATFNNLKIGQLTPYDIKPEKDDYSEIGLTQRAGSQVFSVTEYYKNAVDMLDDTQLLNTAIAESFNWQKGFVYGTEFSIHGFLSQHWSDFFNYSYEIAKGEGIAGGIFALPVGTTYSSTSYEFLDHGEINYANAGFTYQSKGLWITTQGIYGSGLHTGPTNASTLPQHFTLNISLGYAFKKGSGLNGNQISLDLMNLFNTIYPIFIENGFDGNQYAAGREFMLRWVKNI
jgi:hypothetical protein